MASTTDFHADEDREAEFEIIYSGAEQTYKSDQVSLVHVLSDKAQSLQTVLVRTLDPRDPFSVVAVHAGSTAICSCKVHVAELYVLTRGCGRAHKQIEQCQ